MAVSTPISEVPTRAVGNNLKELQEKGFTVLEDVLDRDQIKELVELSYRVYENSDRAAERRPLHSLTYYKQDDRFLGLLENPAVLALVTSAMSENLSVYHTHLDVHPVNAVRTQHWHQDVDAISRDCTGLGRPLFLKVGYYLSDVTTPEHGATRVQPGSHLTGEFDPDNPGDPLMLRAGSAVVFDHRLWHTRGLNTVGPDRLAIFVAYAYPWLRPRIEFEDRIDRSAGLGPALRAGLSVLPPEE